MRKRIMSTITISALFLTVSYLPVLSSEFSAIKDPKPNIMELEKHYVQLKKVKTIDAELGNDSYLFMPYSLTVCSGSGDVFVYDALQAKIFKMDGDLAILKTSFGRTGEGPGEFGGTGKGYPVFIQMGRDNYLYANDARKRKIIAFDQNGKFIREIKYRKPMLAGPLVDSSGNLYTINVDEKVITAGDDKNSPLFTLPNPGENFNFLFSTPGPSFLKFGSLFPEDMLINALTVDSKFLLYFSSSSTMVVLKDKKISNQFRLWPHGALKHYKTEIAKMNEKQANTYLSMFLNLFVDETNADLFFLQGERNEEKKIDSLYQFNSNGQLVKIFYVQAGEGAPFVHFKANNNGRFYAIEDDKLALYREMK